MSVAAMAWVIDHSKATQSTFAVLLVMAEAANSVGEDSRLAVATIAVRARVGETTVHRAIRWLVHAGEVELTGQQTGRGNVNVYRLPRVKGVMVAPFEAPKGYQGGTLFEIPAPERVPSAPLKGAMVAPEPSTNQVPKRVSRATPTPNDFAITDRLRDWARQKVPAGVDLDAETEQFLDWHRAKGSLHKDWAAAWRTWMRRARPSDFRLTESTQRRTERNMPR